MRLSISIRVGLAIGGVALAAVCLQAQAPATRGADSGGKEAGGDEALLRAGGLPPRASAAEYQFRAQAGTVTVAAEFMGHGVATLEGGPYTTEDYVIVEAALFGPPGARLALDYRDFSLRVNGKKMPMPSSPYLAVYKSLKDPEWEPTSAEKDKGKTAIGGGGAGGGSPDLPALIKMPIEMRRAMEQRVKKVSLAEGERPLPQAGLLFFEYRAEVKSIHSLELIYNGPAGKAALALQK